MYPISHEEIKSLLTLPNIQYMVYDGELVMRGIETRRHNTPNFIKQFQTELLYTLFGCENIAEIYDKTLEDALFCITKKSTK